jgi:hypothetical protein
MTDGMLCIDVGMLAVGVGQITISVHGCLRWRGMPTILGVPSWLMAVASDLPPKFDPKTNRENGFHRPVRSP